MTEITSARSHYPPRGKGVGLLQFRSSVEPGCAWDPRSLKRATVCLVFASLKREDEVNPASVRETANCLQLPLPGQNKARVTLTKLRSAHASHRRPLSAEPRMETADQTEMWFLDSEPQQDRTGYRRMRDLELRETRA